MSGALEKSVRPFQLPAVAPRRIPTGQVTDAGDVILQFGMSPGQTKTYTSNYSWTMTFYCAAHQVEKWSTTNFPLFG